MAAEYVRYMPVKTAEDQASVLRSPMPGRVLIAFIILPASETSLDRYLKQESFWPPFDASSKQYLLVATISGERRH